MLKDEAFALQPDIVQWRRALHQIPEVGLHLPETRDYLCTVLDGMGLSYRLYQNSSGIELLLKGDNPGPTAALRADMDALPLQEKTGLPYAAAGDRMHACGHDAHMAMLLGAVQLLSRRRSFSGHIKCLFQPGEEGFRGAASMVAEGAMEDPRVDAVFGLHVTNSLPELTPGALGLRAGALMAGSDAFTIQVTGKGGHISDTQLVKNPIPAAAQIALCIQELSLHSQQLPDKGVVALGIIQGGQKNNIVPSCVQLQGSVRTMSQETRSFILQQLEKIVSNCAAQSGCTAGLSLFDSNAIVVNDPELSAYAHRSIQKLFPGEAVELTSEVMASEDISDFFAGRKGVYLHLGCGFPDHREVFPLHSPRFTLNEDILWRGSAILAQSALDWLERSV